MSPKPPVLKPREVIALLTRHGFTEARQRRSHKQFRHLDGRSTTVPVHAGRDIAPTLLRQIARDVGLTLDEFLNPS
ncbi:MAG TPA: type II toxin-antitoxin system HicA family toxin [Gemmatimonadaceae bacterium]|nr:type II toxin-antitoxin system HicA family toxin [Gemmatimonadaceae bacterium]